MGKPLNAEVSIRQWHDLECFGHPYAGGTWLFWNRANSAFTLQGFRDFACLGANPLHTIYGRTHPRLPTESKIAKFQFAQAEGDYGFH